MSKLYNKMPPLPKKGTKSTYNVSTKKLYKAVMQGEPKPYKDAEKVKNKRAYNKQRGVYDL